MFASLWGKVYPIDIYVFEADIAGVNAQSPVKSHRKASVFKSNRSQAVRIPKDLAFPDDVKEVYILQIGKKLEIIPVGALWDDFFDRDPNPDFPDREQPPVQERDFDL